MREIIIGTSYPISCAADLRAPYKENLLWDERPPIISPNGEIIITATRNNTVYWKFVTIRFNIDTFPNGIRINPSITGVNTMYGAILNAILSALTGTISCFWRSLKTSATN